MTDSPAEPRTRRPGIAVFVLAAACVLPPVCAGTSFAESGPVRLAPPKKLKPVVPVVPVQPAIPATESGGDEGPSIQIDTLQTINADTAGVLFPEEGGFGVRMWAGSSPRLVWTMMDRLPLNVRSEVMRDLMRRLLLSSAALPEGMAADGRFIARRVGLLSEMGDADSVNRLLEATPGRAEMETLVRYEADARFLANDNARACSLAAGQIGSEDSAYWQKAFVFCQALAGEHDRAALGVSLLRETGDEDEAFYALIEALAGYPASLERMPDPTPMLLSMARASKTRLPNDVISSSRPGVLKTIATSPNASVEIRLEAAERAEIAGALDVDTLRQLYTGVSFSEEDLANPLSKAEAETGPLSRALLYRTTLIETLPVAQAEATAKALALGREGGRYSSTVRVFMPVLARIAPSTELLWFAPEAIRAFLVSGRHEEVAPWFSLLRTSAQHNPESAAILHALLPIARLAGSPEAAPWNTGDLSHWWEPLKEENHARDKAALLYTLFDALGETVPTGAWEELLDGPQQITMAMPNPALWRGLNEAIRAASAEPEAVPETPPQTAVPPQRPLMTTVSVSAAGIVSAEPVEETPVKPAASGERIGEIVLLSLVALGEGGPGLAEPIVLGKVMEGLSAAGLDKEVRALALEAAIAAGL